MITNLNEQIATPVEINIIVPSYVDVYRDNNLIDTQYFAPGNHFIDTRSFPSGAYLLRLHIRTLNNQTTTKQIYFVKTTALPLLSLPNFYLSYGQLAEFNTENILPTLTNLNLFSLRTQQRLHKFLGIGESVMFFDDRHIMGELSLIGELSYLRLETSGAFSNFNTAGFGFVLSGSLYDISLNSYFRKIWALSTATHKMNEYFEYIQTSNTNIGTSFLFNWQNFNFHMGLGYGYYGDQLQHDIEFDITREFTFGSENTLSISFEFDISNTNKSVLFKINWDLGSSNSWGSTVGFEGQMVKIPTESLSHDVDIILGLNKSSTTQTTSSDFGTNAQISQKNQYYSQHVATGNKYFDASGQLDFAQSKDNGDTLNYNLKFSTALAYSPLNYWGISSATPQSGIMIRVNSALASEYTVYVDGRPSRTIKNNATYFIPLTSYREHNIQIQTHELSLSVSQNDNDVVVYPGNVQTISSEAKPSILLMGNFVNTNGKTLEYASIEGGLEPAITDNEGFAQIDVLQGDELTIIHDGGTKCHVKTDTLKPEDGFVFLDQIVCQ